MRALMHIPQSLRRQRGFFTPMPLMPSQFLVSAADFDGTNDLMRRVGGLTGAADSKSGTCSLWLRLDGGDGADQTIIHAATTLAGATSRFRVRRRNSNVFEVVGVNAAGSTIMSRTTSGSYTAGATWLHLLSSWDLAAAAFHLYMNDVSDDAGGILTNDTIDYTVADWAVGAQANAGTKTNGCLAEVYFKLGQYIDLSVAANRRKFISSSGKPAKLGSDGSRPGLGVPEIYQHLDDGEAVANFATNRGGGGNFTITGALGSASSSPSD